MSVPLSVSVLFLQCGIDLDAVAEMGRVIKMAAERTADRDAIGCNRLSSVMQCLIILLLRGAFHGVTEPETVINVGVSGPGVVKTLRRRQCADRTLAL